MTTKLVIILIIAITSSILALFVIVFFDDWTLLAYTLDSTINCILLWFTFEFAKYYYHKYCCGKICVLKCFPIVKSCALSCECQSNKNGCISCIHCLCKYCVKKNEREKSRNIYRMAKNEVSLILNEL